MRTLQGLAEVATKSRCEVEFTLFDMEITLNNRMWECVLCTENTGPRQVARGRTSPGSCCLILPERPRCAPARRLQKCEGPGSLLWKCVIVRAAPAFTLLAEAFARRPDKSWVPAVSCTLAWPAPRTATRLSHPSGLGSCGAPGPLPEPSSAGAGSPPRE